MTAACAGPRHQHINITYCFYKVAPAAMPWQRHRIRQKSCPDGFDQRAYPQPRPLGKPLQANKLAAFPIILLNSTR